MLDTDGSAGEPVESLTSAGRTKLPEERSVSLDSLDESWEAEKGLPELEVRIVAEECDARLEIVLL